MSNTLQAPETTVLDALDFTINCGAPCCGPRLYVCEGRATYLRTITTIIHCSKCGRDHPNTAYRFTPIETP